MRQTLVFDADDTLWECTALFERVIADYLDWLGDDTVDRPAVRAVLDDTERANVALHGYGSACFLRSLHDCYERVRGRPAGPPESAHIGRLAAPLLELQVVPGPDVVDTLAELGGRHDLLLLTKGDLTEQRRKIDGSGLAGYFAGVHIVAEKRVPTYRDLLRGLDLHPGQAWMIGNSPVSDILPARAVGMGAVFIPNAHTWVLDHGELDPADDGVLRLARFGELRTHF